MGAMELYLVPAPPLFYVIAGVVLAVVVLGGWLLRRD
jgi:hypothetical protein